LFEAELLVEGDGGGEIVDADGDVGDAVEGRGWDAVGLGLAMGEVGDQNEGECSGAGKVGPEGIQSRHLLLRGSDEQPIVAY
jgi:hypothetical protein